MPKKGEKNRTMEGYLLSEQISSPILLGEEEQCLPIRERHKSQGFRIPNIQNKYSMVSGHGRAQKGC